VDEHAVEAAGSPVAGGGPCEAKGWRDGVFASATPLRPGSGLAGLCGSVLGAPLHKYWQMSDWRQRPLYPGQREYAALDAFVLPRVLLRLLAIGQRNGALPK
jgi:ribonuclease D